MNDQRGEFSPPQTRIVVTCEHAGNDVPPHFRPLFHDAAEVLKSHRGWDPGALSIAQGISERINAPLFYCTTTRLLVEVNRSLDQPDLFSKWSSCLSHTERKKLVAEIYTPYREQVEATIRELSKEYFVLHLSIHSFTPVFDGIPRKTDLGILFDPERPSERKFSQAWKESLEEKLPGKNVQFNLPYHGTSDGFTTYLRTQFPDAQYAGIELEVNQKYLQDLVTAKSCESQLTNSVAELLVMLNEV